MEGYSRILWTLVPMLIGRCPEAEPYWGMKIFFAPALPEDHPFWQAEEKPYSPPNTYYGTSAVYAIEGYRRGEVLHVECNTNLMQPRTVLPTLHAMIEPGETTLICAVYADTDDQCPQTIPQEVLSIAKAL